jgi:trehalose-phosphatase
MLAYVNSHPIDKWAYRFLKDIKFINQKRRMLIGNEGRQLLNDKLVKERKKQFVLSREFVQTFKESKARLIIILLNKVQEIMIDKNSDEEEEEDFSGSEESEKEISEVTLGLIDRLSKNKNTKIWVISADEKSKVHNTFAKIENVGLSAEDGYYYRWHSKDEESKLDWSIAIDDDDCSWIELVRSVMKIFTESTEGSYIEERDSMIIWNYSKVAQDYGQGQMKELSSLLKDLFRNFEIDINERKGKLECKSKAEPKSLILKIMNKMSIISPIDFVFAFGDDERYHDVFSFLDSKKNYNRFCASNCSSSTCTIKGTQFLQSVLMKLLAES